LADSGPLAYLLITGASAAAKIGTLVFDTVVEYVQETSLKKLQQAEVSKAFKFTEYLVNTFRRSFPRMTVLDGTERDELCDIVKSFSRRPVDDLVNYLMTHKTLHNHHYHGHHATGEPMNNLRYDMQMDVNQALSD